MAMFDELREGFTKWHDSHIQYRSNSERFPGAFAKALGDYLKAPKEYKDPAKPRRSVPYVQAMHVTFDNEGYYEIEDPKDWDDVIYMCDDGYWLSGVGVVLDRDLNAFPKKRLAVPFKFRLPGTTCEIIIEQQTFSFPLNDQAKWIPAFEHITNLMKQMLSQNPWEMTAKNKIGFIDYDAAKS